MEPEFPNDYSACSRIVLLLVGWLVAVRVGGSDSPFPFDAWVKSFLGERETALEICNRTPCCLFPHALVKFNLGHCTRVHAFLFLRFWHHVCNLLWGTTTYKWTCNVMTLSHPSSFPELIAIGLSQIHLALLLLDGVSLPTSCILSVKGPCEPILCDRNLSHNIKFVGGTCESSIPRARTPSRINKK